MKKYDIRKDDFATMLNKANKGNKNALLAVGQCYQLGIQTNKDINSSIHYLELAANKGSSEAMYELSYIYTFEKDFINYETANDWIQKAAFRMGRKNNISALIFLSRLITNNQENFRLINKAAKLKNIDAINMLGEFYRDGIGTSVNEEKAIKLFNKAAKMGNSDAMYNLAEYYYKEKKYDLFCDYIEKSAALGNIQAVSRLDEVESFKEQKRKLTELDKNEERKRLIGYYASINNSKSNQFPTQKEQKNNGVNEKLEKEHNTFYHYETKISVRYYNEHSGFMGQSEYDADADVTFYYKNYYGQTKTRSTTIKFSNVKYNSVSVHDCEYRCSSYLKEY